jgi:hypothetical protein
MEKEQASKKTISRTKKGKSQLPEQLEINRSRASSPKKGFYKLGKKQQQSNPELLADDFALVKDGGLSKSAQMDAQRTELAGKLQDGRRREVREDRQHKARIKSREAVQLSMLHQPSGAGGVKPQPVMASSDELDLLFNRSERLRQKVKVNAPQASEKPADKIFGMLRVPREKGLVIRESNTIMDTFEECAESYLSTEDASCLRVFDDLLSKEIQRQGNLKISDTITEDPNRCNPYDQPEDVFERMWTRVSPTNPGWQMICENFGKLVAECESNHRSLTGCSSCMTVFTPCFPADHHLHNLCNTFKKALRKKKSSGDQMQKLTGDADGDLVMLDPTRALLVLANSAKALGKDELGEYIKIPRIVVGQYSREVKGKFDCSEFCHNCDVQNTPRRESQMKYAKDSLINSILFMIDR